MQNLEHFNPFTPHVNQAIADEAVDFIMADVRRQQADAQKSAAEQKAAAEAADLQKRLIQNKTMDLFIERVARKALKDTFGDDAPPARSFGDWLQAAVTRNNAHLEKVYGAGASVLSVPERGHWSPRQKAAMGETSGAIGGYTVPVEYAREIMAVAAELGFVRRRAQIATMTSATLQYPLLDVTTAQAAGTSPFSGGLLMSWLAEAQTRTETEPQFKQLELKAWELSGSVVVSRPLLADGINLDRYVKMLVGNAVAEYEEQAFLVGNGVGKPQGILGAGATLSVTRQSGNVIQYADAAGMLAKLPPGSPEYACWTCSPSALPQLLELKDNVTSERAVVLHAGVGETPERPRMTFAGLPLKVSQWQPALGTKGDLMLADWRYYVIGERGLFIASSEVPNFTKNQVNVRVVDRVDGQPWIDKPITLQDSSTQVSPFVVLN